MPPTHKKDSLSEEIISEIVAVSISIINGVAFTIGSVYFLPEYSNKIGDIIFVVAGVLGVLQSGASLVAACQWEPQGDDDEQDVLLPLHNNKQLNAIQSALLYFISNIIFVAGSFCFWPDIKSWFGEETEITLASAGAWLFVTGSMGFAIAAFNNGLALGKTYGTKKDRGFFDVVYRMKKNALLCALIGSISFVVGSILYRPGLSKSCTPIGANATDASGKPLETVDPNDVFSSKCADVALFGTYLYILGSVLFLLEALLDMAAIIYELKVAKEDGESSGAE